MNLKYFTQGIIYHKEMIVPFYVKNNNEVEKNIEDYFRILFIENGGGIVSVNKNKISVLSPALILVNNRDNFSIINKSDDLKIKTIYFHPNVINGEFNFENLYNPEIVFKSTVNQDKYMFLPFISNIDANKVLGLNVNSANNIKFFIENMNKELNDQSDHMWPCTARGFLIQLLYLIQKLVNGTKETNNMILPEDIIEIEEIVLYILLNYDQKITIPELAKIFKTNRTTISKKFKDKMGTSIFAFLIKLRLEVASSLMHNTELQINEVMYKVGINDLTYFGRLFKTKYKLTPSEYRDKYKKMLY